ncbi:hypothetical protein GC105_00720 [Alkalibaculum sp. M08DMB]|uniref:Heavy-metal-associated domain-containing protein n=1 Tax=Alkalibaculum sporogenes TaxID=2655001 RepID=A0A6A7K4C5_9FIRM|nr:hypothetical protein [Alkalibaculum sporogenes]MPW24316.1 hypothetical protein [Alkalibaculum sporogenes]
MQKIRLNIDGLVQKETQVRVIDQLDGIIGVQDLNLSDDEKFIEVYYDDQTSEDAINSHLQNNGYKIYK